MYKSAKGHEYRLGSKFTYPFEIESFRIGCQTFTRTDVVLIDNAIKLLNK